MDNSQIRWTYYKLVGKETFPCMAVEATIGKNNTIARTDIGPCWVSTVFLCINHNFGLGEPLLFETMVFPNDSMIEEYVERYSTYDEAMKGHERICKMVAEEHKQIERIIDLE